MKSYFGCCVDNPFGDTDKLIEIIDESNVITKKRFLENCTIEDIDLYNIPLKRFLRKFPYDFQYYENSKDKIMFFTHSGIEYFFKEIEVEED